MNELKEFINYKNINHITFNDLAIYNSEKDITAFALYPDTNTEILERVNLNNFVHINKELLRYVFNLNEKQILNILFNIYDHLYKNSLIKTIEKQALSSFIIIVKNYFQCDANMCYVSDLAYRKENTFDWISDLKKGLNYTGEKIEDFKEKETEILDVINWLEFKYFNNENIYSNCINVRNFLNDMIEYCGIDINIEGKDISINNFLNRINIFTYNYPNKKQEYVIRTLFNSLITYYLEGSIALSSDLILILDYGSYSDVKKLVDRSLLLKLINHLNKNIEYFKIYKTDQSDLYRKA